MTKNINFSLPFLLLFITLISCKSQKVTELDISKNLSEKIQIYVRRDTIKLGKEFPGEVKVGYLKLDFNDNTIAFAGESYVEGERKNSADALPEFKKSKTDYFIVTKKDAFEVPKSVLKYKRKWNDFATPGRSVTPAMKLVIIENTIRFKRSKSLNFHVLNPSLTKKANGN